MNSVDLSCDPAPILGHVEEIETGLPVDDTEAFLDDAYERLSEAETPIGQVLAEAIEERDQALASLAEATKERDLATTTLEDQQCIWQLQLATVQRVADDTATKLAVKMAELAEAISEGQRSSVEVRQLRGECRRME